jgi:hypothetical protein
LRAEAVEEAGVAVELVVVVEVVDSEAFEETLFIVVDDDFGGMVERCQIHANVLWFISSAEHNH